MSTMSTNGTNDDLSALAWVAGEVLEPGEIVRCDEISSRKTAAVLHAEASEVEASAFPMISDHRDGITLLLIADEAQNTLGLVVVGGGVDAGDDVEQRR